MCSLSGRVCNGLGARELKQHTGALIERIKRGERLRLTHCGSPIAIITPINSAAFERLLEREAEDAESLAWFKASESAFGFWDNAEDQVWHRARDRRRRSRAICFQASAGFTRDVN